MGAYTNYTHALTRSRAQEIILKKEVFKKQTFLILYAYVFFGMTDRPMDQVSCILDAFWKDVSLYKRFLHIFPFSRTDLLTD